MLSVLSERRNRPTLRRCIVCLVAACFAGCSAPPPLPPPPEGAPPGFPSTDLSRAASASATVLSVDSSASLVKALVYRGGALSRLGHDHVVAARNLHGLVVVGEGDANERTVAAEFYAALAGMSIDEPELRQAAGFESEPSDEDRRGTRRNMLKTFAAGEHPFVQLSLNATIRGDAFRDERSIPADVAITLAGASQRYTIDVAVTGGEGGLVASGRFSIRHGDFGVEPFSVLGGALAVQDRIDVEFEVRAQPDTPGARSAH